VYHAVQEPFTEEELRVTLLAALLLPLRLAAVGPATKPTPVPSHVILNAMKWRKRDALAVCALHADATELLRIHEAIGVRSLACPFSLPTGPATVTARVAATSQLFQT
jgi:hypothetical protein